MPRRTVKHLFARFPTQYTTSRWPTSLAHFFRRFSGKKVSQAGRAGTLQAACVLLIIAGPAVVRPQTLQLRIAITSQTPAKIRIIAEVQIAISSLSFRNTYGGVLGLGERIGALEASRAGGETVSVQKLAPGEFQAAAKFTRFSYDVDLTEPPRPAQMSHVSWLTRDYGLLMLADLLPQSTKKTGDFPTARIHFDVPTGWTVAANVKNEGNLQFSTDDPDKAVFMVGPSLLETSRRISSVDLSIIRSGGWPFSEGNAVGVMRKIIQEYAKVTGFELKGNEVLMLLPFPGDAGPQRWTAETRGNAVVLLLGSKASTRDVLNMLGIVLSHELFHLWVPNSLKLLQGEYDWFFEGFTLYQALRMDLRLGLISFQEYLATIARAYDSYLSSADRDRLSLVEASERRWTTSTSLVYDKGLLVAFIYDLKLRNLSNCKASLDDIYKQLFRPESTRQQGANETIIRLLSEPEGMDSFADTYVQGAGRINLESVLSPYGFRVQRSGSGTTLAVDQNLNKTQRKLLGCVGYRK